MDSYDEFKQDLNRMPMDRRSSQNTTSPRDPRSQTTNQWHDKSLYTIPLDDSGTQKSDEDTQAHRRELEERTEARPANRSEQFTTQRVREAPHENAGGQSLNLKNFNRTAQQMISQPDRTMSEWEAGREGQAAAIASSRPSNLSELATRLSERFNASGRPFNISEFATRPVAPQLQASHMYYASGRPLNLSEFARGRPGSQARPSGHHNASTQTVNLSEFPGDSALAQRQAFETYSAFSWPLTAHFDHSRSHERHNAARGRQDLEPNRGCLLNSSELGHGSDQAHPGSLNTSHRRANLDGNRSASVQRPDVSQIPAFTSAVGWTPACQMASRKNQAYNFTLKTPLKGFDFCGDSPSSSLMTAHRQGAFSKGRGLADQSGCKFHWDMAPFDSGLRRQTPSQGNPHSGPPTRHPLFNTLVRDTYFPGAIDDAVNGKVDFNAIAFDSAFGSGPIPDELDDDDVPMSLLQAFEERLNYEDDLRASLKRRRREFSPAPLQPQSTEEGPDPTCWIHRDELKLASTVDIDLATIYRDQPETGLTTALACLAKAEKMNDFDKCVHLAEEAIRKRKADTPPEKAALRSSCSFHINMKKDETKTEETAYNPIEIVSYVGTTKPREE